MSTPRLFLPSPLPETDEAVNQHFELTGQEARYATTVLRLGRGDTVILQDEEGRAGRGIVVSAGKRSLVVSLEEPPEKIPEPRLQLMLLQGLLKGRKMDLVIQKAVELGVHRVVPLVTERSQPRETRKTPRWREIARAAARQCGRGVPPEVEEPVELANWLRENGESGGRVNGLMLEAEARRGLSEVAPELDPKRPLWLLCGPEGGLSEAELGAARKAGFLEAHMGPRILRAETASLSAMAALQALIGDMQAGR